MKVYIGADHRGYELKKKIAQVLDDKNIEFEDLGAHELNPEDDYTTFAGRVSSAVSEDEGSMGILACGSGVGVDIMANKFDGVRASIGKEPDQVEAGRRDDNMNTLVLAADYTKEEEAIEMLDRFIKTKYKSKKRYERRLKDIERLEEIN